MVRWRISLAREAGAVDQVNPGLYSQPTFLSVHNLHATARHLSPAAHVGDQNSGSDLAPFQSLRVSCLIAFHIK